jgi:hypothetical protein
MRMTIAAALIAMSMMVGGNADAKYTVSRPIDNFLGNWLDHTYTIEDDWASCVEQFGGGCDCAGSTSCYWWQNGAGTSACYDSNFFYRWTYGSQGVCHQATNNNAYYMGGPGGITSSSIRGMGISTGMFGNWGTDGGC